MVLVMKGHFPVFVRHHRQEGCDCQNHGTQSKQAVQELVPAPLVLLVAIGDDLSHSKDSPAEPHHPSVDREDPLCPVHHLATTSLTVQFNIKEAIAVIVVRQ